MMPGIYLDGDVAFTSFGLRTAGRWISCFRVGRVFFLTGSMDTSFPLFAERYSAVTMRTSARPSHPAEIYTPTTSYILSPWR